jgi:hypothetical protein
MNQLPKYIAVWKDLKENKIYRTTLHSLRAVSFFCGNRWNPDRKVLYLFKIKYKYGKLRKSGM